MSTVIENILARRGKKVPINDGRKIALVLFGGLITGVRGGGAIVALDELGLANVFDEVYVISAGLPNISYLLAGGTQLGISIYYQDLIGRRFINFLRFWKIVDIDYLISVFKNTKPLNVQNILNCQTKVYVALRHVQTDKIKYLEIHDYAPSAYFELLEATISIPYLHPGAVSINGSRYMDVGNYNGGFLHVQKAIDAGATDILVVYNNREQKTHCFDNDSIFEILPDNDWELSRFETKPEVIIAAAEQMGSLVKKVFHSQETVKIKWP
ncbi:MAG: hypothetical protein WCV50_05740 [Patescibacteria group bacterium]|jgi:predicted patatin/cPLA2 family phospholipase